MAPTSQTDSARLLLIDDTPDNLHLLSGLLSGQGYRIYTANNGESGLELAQQINPDLVLLDIVMPGMDGFEVCRKLKADKSTQSIPVIFLTAIDNTDIIVDGLRQGAVDYITRPFGKEVLMARVSTHIQNGKLTRRLQDAVDEKTRELNKANSNLKKLAYQIGMVEEQERRSIAVGLHNGPIQELGWVYMQLDTLNNESELESTSKTCSDALERLDMVIDDLRYLIFDLSPPVLYELGFNAALEWLINDFGNRYQFDFKLSLTGDDSNISTELAIVLFQSTRELMVNVIKHANASIGRVHCSVGINEITIEVIDNGDGFSTEEGKQGNNPYSGFGLFGIRQKLEQHRGRLLLIPDDNGTKMRITAPLLKDPE